MKQIYIAAPMFSEAELNFNSHIAEQLEQLGYSVFLPQKAGYKLVSLLEQFSATEARKMIFNKDYNAVKDSDILLIILDGRVIDEGACIELGMSFAFGKICYGLKTDPRTMMNGQINPMISECLAQIFYSINEMLTYFKKEVTT